MLHCDVRLRRLSILSTNQARKPGEVVASSLATLCRSRCLDPHHRGCPNYLNKPNDSASAKQVTGTDNLQTDRILIRPELHDPESRGLPIRLRFFAHVPSPGGLQRRTSRENHAWQTERLPKSQGTEELFQSRKPGKLLGSSAED